MRSAAMDPIYGVGKCWRAEIGLATLAIKKQDAHAAMYQCLRSLRSFETLQQAKIVAVGGWCWSSFGKRVFAAVLRMRIRVSMLSLFSSTSCNGKM